MCTELTLEQITELQRIECSHQSFPCNWGMYLELRVPGLEYQGYICIRKIQKMLGECTYEKAMAEEFTH